MKSGGVCICLLIFFIVDLMISYPRVPMNGNLIKILGTVSSAFSGLWVWLFTHLFIILFMTVVGKLFHDSNFIISFSSHFNRILFEYSLFALLTSDLIQAFYSSLNPASRTLSWNYCVLISVMYNRIGTLRYIWGHCMTQSVLIGMLVKHGGNVNVQNTASGHLRKWSGNVLRMFTPHLL